MNKLKRPHLLLDERRNRPLIILLVLSLLGVPLIFRTHPAATALESPLLYQLDSNGRIGRSLMPMPNNREDAGQIPASDCLHYRDVDLNIADLGSMGWGLFDGLIRLHLLDNRSDAERALALANRHEALCFFGRESQRRDIDKYIVEYWKGDSHNPSSITTINNEDCIPYDQHNLVIVDIGANGWLLTDGGSLFQKLDNKGEAEQALELARRHSRRCFIGRNNSRPFPMTSAYIIGYWQ
jgi:hypothetical protein